MDCFRKKKYSCSGLMFCVFCFLVEFYFKKIVGVFVMWGKYREGLMRGLKLVWFLYFLLIRISIWFYILWWSIVNYKLFKFYWDMVLMFSIEGVRWVGIVFISLNRVNFIDLVVRINYFDEFWGFYFKIRINFFGF